MTLEHMSLAAAAYFALGLLFAMMHATQIRAGVDNNPNIQDDMRPWSLLVAAIAAVVIWPILLAAKAWFRRRDGGEPPSPV